MYNLSFCIECFHFYVFKSFFPFILIGRAWCIRRIRPLWIHTWGVISYSHIKRWSHWLFTTKIYHSRTLFTSHYMYINNVGIESMNLARANLRLNNILCLCISCNRIIYQAKKCPLLLLLLHFDISLVRYDFNFHIVNFPFICSNLQAAFFSC